MVNRGLIPPNVDLTPAFASGSAPPVSHAPAHFHGWSTQFEKSSVYTSPFGFNVSNLRLDLTAPAAVPQREPSKSAARRQLGSSPPRHGGGARTVTLGHDGPMEGGAMGAGAGSVASSARMETGSVRSSAMGNGEEEEGNDGNLREAVDKIRGYNELLDTYSLHQVSRCH